MNCISILPEEIIVNIASYAYNGYDSNPDKPCVIIVSGRVNTELGEATIIIRDNAQYEYNNNKNILILTKKV